LIRRVSRNESEHFHNLAAIRERRKNKKEKFMNSEATLDKSAEEQVNDSTRSRGSHFYRPRVDIVEQGDELQLVLDMPGVKPTEIDVQWKDGELRVHGPVNLRQTPETRYLMQEYGVGNFDRTFRVSEQIDASRIRAEYLDGVLTLHLPKVEAAKPRKIAVTGS
jgi:HSP20 family protein